MAVEGGGGDGAKIVAAEAAGTAQRGVVEQDVVGAKFDDGAVLGAEADGEGLVAKNGVETGGRAERVAGG